MGPCHHGMARPQVADRGTASDRGVATNILNKQSWTADKGWSSSFGGLDEVLTTPPCKTLMLRNIHVRDACSGDKNCIGSWRGNRRERDHWGDLGVDG